MDALPMEFKRTDGGSIVIEGPDKDGDFYIEIPLEDSFWMRGEEAVKLANYIISNSK